MITDGSVTFQPRSIQVRLRPAATPDERLAFTTLLREINAAHLTLPGDPNHRPLRFATENS